MQVPAQQTDSVHQSCSTDVVGPGQGTKAPPGETETEEPSLVTASAHEANPLHVAKRISLESSAEADGSHRILGLSMTSKSQAVSSSVTTKSATNSSNQPCGVHALVSTVAEQEQSTHEAWADQQSMHAQKRSPPNPTPQQEAVQSSQPSTFVKPYDSFSLMPPPGPEASHDDKVDFIQQQLDSFGSDVPIFDDLLSLGSGDNERREGGWPN